jgi:hypothetical protein
LCYRACRLQGKLIGQGSFGSVYLGIDLHTGKEVRSAAVVGHSSVHQLAVNWPHTCCAAGGTSWQ